LTERTRTLKSLEVVLESFLHRVVELKGEGLAVMESINRLDDIARQEPTQKDFSMEVGDWFAEHNDWLTEKTIRPEDASRISKILSQIKDGLRTSPEISQETEKISSEIERWQDTLTPGPRKLDSTLQKLVLRRGGETISEIEKDSILKFTEHFESMFERWKDVSGGKAHIMSALDDCLNSAYLQLNEEALFLSGFIIYYLRLKNYLVEPYVKRLKAAESLIKKAKAESSYAG
jgi:hypothetical protein